MKNGKRAPKRRVSAICKLHYVKMGYRGLLLLWALVFYVVGRVFDGARFYELPKYRYAVVALCAAVGVVYVIEMILRFFPSRHESMGCQKQFRRNYLPTGEETPKKPAAWRTLVVLLVWLALNGAIGGLYFGGVIDEGILLIVSLFYGVCDMICILFFCPFQVWFMRNRCCTVCRIYNWDFAMMFTPFVFIPHPFTWSLLALALALFLRWEITLRVRPERFSENTNACLSCRHCDEKLCQHKRHLLKYVAKSKADEKITK